MLERQIDISNVQKATDQTEEIHDNKGPDEEFLVDNSMESEPSFTIKASQQRTLFHFQTDWADNVSSGSRGFVEDTDEPFVKQTKVSSRFHRSPDTSVPMSLSIEPAGSSYIGNVSSSFQQKNSQKLKPRDFDDNDLEWPEWSGTFLSMIDSRVKSLVNDKAKNAINGSGFSSARYAQAWETLQRKFGQPSFIVSTKLAKIQNRTFLPFDIMIHPHSLISSMSSPRLWELYSSLVTLMISSQTVI